VAFRRHQTSIGRKMWHFQTIGGCFPQGFFPLFRPGRETSFHIVVVIVNDCLLGINTVRQGMKFVMGVSV